jgi:hypothetical protein
MVRVWSHEVGDAKSVILPLVRMLEPTIEVLFAPPRGVSRATAEVTLKKGRRQARCVVTFEAWERARQDPDEMAAAFRKIIEAIGKREALPAYLLTSRGLAEEPPTKPSELLHSIATGTEGDVLAEQFFNKVLRKSG